VLVLEKIEDDSGTVEASLRPDRPDVPARARERRASAIEARTILGKTRLVVR